MVGSERGKEAMAMMALHEALRNVCMNSDWTYSVFWTIRPRPRSRGGTGCKVGDENGSLMLMWEDGYCRSSKPPNSRQNRLPAGPFNGNGMSKSQSFDCLEEMDADDPVRKAFRKMSIQLYNYGEGLMGKVASDKCHKWVFKEPNECEAGISNYWQSSFDAHPPEWTDQFASGIQTIVVIQAGHGLLQLGSCKIIPEDLHFVLRMRHAFDSLGYQSGFYLSQLFSSRTNNNNPPLPLPQPKPAVSPRPPIYNWNHRQALQAPPGGLVEVAGAQLRPQESSASSHLLGVVPSQSAVVQTHNSSNNNNGDRTLSGTPDSLVLSASEMLCNQDTGDIKWPNGLSYLTALTARADDKQLFFGPEYPDSGSVHIHPQQQQQQQGLTVTKPLQTSSEYLSLDSGTNIPTRRMHALSRLDKFKRSLTMPARMSTTASPATSPHLSAHPSPHALDPQQQQQQQQPEAPPLDFSMNQNSAGGNLYSDIMEGFLE